MMDPKIFGNATVILLMVLKCEQVCLVNKVKVNFVNGTVRSLYYLINIINSVIVQLHKQHRPHFMMTILSHQSCIIREWWLHTKIP